MLVESLKHGRLVLESFKDLAWFALDTETKALSCYTRKDDVLAFGRARVLIWSMANKGESYSFPTNYFDPKYPLIQEWFEILEPLVWGGSVVVMHNANYDVNVFWNSGLKKWPRIWDTMIGAWMADANMEKGLKARAPRYGRNLRQTKGVNFGDLTELAEYAEQDVVQTDELYQMQRFGVVDRPDMIRFTGPGGQKVYVPNPMPSVKLEVEGESLRNFDRLFLRFQEFPVLRAAMRAERTGFPCSKKKLKKIRIRLHDDKEERLKKVYRYFGSKVNLNSTKAVAKALHALGVKTPFSTRKGAPSLAYAALVKMQEQHEVVKLLLECRRLEKLESVYVGSPFSTNAEDFGLEYYIHSDGRIHCVMNTCGAVTGRFSAQLPNLQQLPSRADLYGIKDCFEAPKGHSLICLDYAQLELRVMALLSKDPVMTKILCDPEGDLHQHTADEFQVERDPTAKQINFLLQYAGTHYALAEKLTLEGMPTSEQQGMAYWQRYNEDVYHRVWEYRQELLEQLQTKGYVSYLTGRRRSLGPVNWENKWESHKAETTISNNIVQGTGQDLLKASIVRNDPACLNPDSRLPLCLKLSRSHRALLSDYARLLEKRRALYMKAGLRWILQIHDEVIYFVQSSAAEEVGNLIADTMTWHHYFPATVKYTVPLVVDGGIGKTWRQAKGKDKNCPPDSKILCGFENWKSD